MKKMEVKNLWYYPFKYIHNKVHVGGGHTAGLGTPEGGSHLQTSKLNIYQIWTQYLKLLWQINWGTTVILFFWWKQPKVTTSWHSAFNEQVSQNCINFKQNSGLPYYILILVLSLFAITVEGGPRK